MILYHYPKCSKSRAALTLLQAKGYEPQLIDYIDNPPTLETLLSLQKKLDNINVLEMMRPKEKAFKEADLKPDSSDHDLLQAITTHPILLQRPILVHHDSAVIARSPDAIETFLSLD